MKVNKQTFIGTFSIVVFFTTSLVHATPPDKGEGWVKVWADEFNDETLNTRKWGCRASSEQFDEGGEVCIYKPSNIKLDGNHLIIENNWHKVPDSNVSGYSGGWVDSQFSWNYGYFEARTKFEKTDNHFWPTFWMWKWQSGSVANEFDIMEFSPWHNCPSQSHHTSGKKSHTTEVSSKRVHKWHEWAVLWTKDEVTFYIDGKKQCSSDDPEDAANENLPIILSCSPTDKTTDFPRKSATYPRFMIDWVRVWQKVGVTVSLTDKQKLIPYETMVVFKSFKGDRFLQVAVSDGLENEQLKVAGPKDENTLSFLVDDLQDGIVALQLAPETFLHVDHTNDFRVYANHNYDDVRQEFEWIPQQDGTMAIKALVNDKYVSINSETGFLHANAEKIGEFEKFKYDVK